MKYFEINESYFYLSRIEALKVIGILKMSRIAKALMAALGGFVVVVMLTYSPMVFSQQIRPIAQSITVQIISPEARKNGSGTVVARNGNTYYVLTAWHVVEEPGNYFIRTYDERQHIVEFSNIERLHNYDLAILRFNSYNNYPLANISERRLASNQTIAISGWRNPTPSLRETTYQFISGTLTGQISPRDGGYSLTFSASGVYSGMSGGPVLDSDYRVVGVIGETEVVIDGITNLHLGIPISIFSNSPYRQYLSGSQLGIQNGIIDLNPRPPRPILTPGSEIYVPEQRAVPRISN